MRILVIQHGTVKDKSCRALRDEYVKRFRRYGKLTVQETKPHAQRGLWPEQRCLKVLLDERGEQWTSPQFAQQLEKWSFQHGVIAFAIGESYGFDEQTQIQADVKWALSSLVLPHQIAHMLVCEQIYRAASILANDPYHHA